MLSALYTGVSGMSANGTSLSVIGDNIANLNTVGFKGSTVAFGDILSNEMGGSQVGRGVSVNEVSPSFTQGSFQTTTNPLDLAIDGDGFFVVGKGVVGQGTAKYYTRAGQFQLAKDGSITNQAGYVLQGYQADSAGNITGTVGNLQLVATQSPSNTTTTAKISVNLDASEAAQAGAFAIDPATGNATNYNKSTTITVYDSQGGAQPVTAYLSKTGNNAWTAHYTFKNAAGAYVEAGNQKMTFGSDGSLTNDNQAPITFNWGNGAANSSITFDFGTGTAEAAGSTGFDGTSQFSSAFSVMSLNQNGFGSGSLQNMAVANDGTITGVFTNGQTRNIGQVALARFVAPTGLTKLGGNLYGETFDSGQPIVGSPTTSGVGRVLSDSLELSNVDLAEQFTSMITAQRGFQANSKIITTCDELLQTMINLKT